jgi:DnaK suppressor protein
MDEEMLLYFKEVLESRSRELIAEAESLYISLKKTGDNRDPMDSADFASSQYALEFMMKIQDRNRYVTKQIRAALNRIKNGEFGICEECGDDIGMGRLKAQPMTTLCVDCMRDMEAVRRLQSYQPSASDVGRAVGSSKN